MSAENNNCSLIQPRIPICALQPTWAMAAMDKTPMAGLAWTKTIR